MHLSSIQRRFVSVLPEKPKGWSDLWTAFVTVCREPVEYEAEILRDNPVVEFTPAHPPFSTHSGVIFTRRIGVRGGETDNNLEASLIVSAEWSAADVDFELADIVGQGRSVAAD
jgi:hypothetical protein